MIGETVRVRLAKRDASQPWGFRIQGGTDFSTPLVVSKVEAGSCAEQADVRVGDMIMQIEDLDATKLRHCQAQDAIRRAVNQVEMTLQRGSVPILSWKPHVEVLSSPAANDGLYGNGYHYTKTSLAAPHQEYSRIGSAHNAQPKPYHGESPGGPAKTFVNKQFNSPLKLYSEKSIAEALNSQSEVLSTGAVGVNFQKSEKQFKQDSEVFKMVREMDENPHYFQSDPSEDSHTAYSKSPVPNRVITPVTPPEPRDNVTVLTSDEVRCVECDKVIQGKYVKLKQKGCLHEGCFKCTTCGSSLKNIGYYIVNQKLYCEIHAKQVSKQGVCASPDRGAGPRNQSPLVNRTAALRISPYKNTTPGSLSQTLESYSLKSEEHSYKKQVSGNDIYEKQSTFERSPGKVPQPGALRAPTGGSKFVWPPPKQRNDSPVCSPAPYSQGLFNSSNQTQTSSIRTAHKSAPYSSPSASANVAAPHYGGSGRQKTGGMFTPRRGTGGTMNQPVTAGGRIPVCAATGVQIRALGKTWSPEHFTCSIANCRRNLLNVGFVEENESLYCENCFLNYLAPTCDKCKRKIPGEYLKAMGKQFHSECFTCARCGVMLGRETFFMEDGLPYCEKDWVQEFTTQCASCGYPIEPGDMWVEALQKSFHSQCFTCTKAEGVLG